MRAWTSPGGLTGTTALPEGVRGPAVRVFDSATDGLRRGRPRPTARPGCTSAGSRRTTPRTWATPRPTSPSTCSTAPGARPASTCATCRTSPTSTTRCSSAPNATGEDWAALAERETELFRTDMEALRVLPPDAYVGAVEAIPLVVAMVEQLQEAGSVYESSTSDLYFSVTRDPAFGEVSGWTREEMLRDLRRARGRPGPSRQEGPARLPAVAGRATRRAGLGLVAGPRPPGLAHRVLRDRARPPRRHHRRAGRRQRPGLPAPRDERLRGAGRRPGLPLRPGLRARRAWSGSTARRCRSPRATSCWSPGCARPGWTRW